MTVLMDNDPVVKISVPIGSWCGPGIHLHSWRRTIGRGGKIGIVGVAHIGAVLGLCLNGVTPCASVAIVVGLEISRCFIEAISIVYVVQNVVPVKQIGDGSVLISRRCQAQIYREIEC